MYHTGSKRVRRVAMAAAVVLVSAMSQVKSSDPDEFNIECYRDLCNTRQYCSDTEERCKPCLPAHCRHKQYTPKECEPLCPELLKTTTTSTTSSSTTTTTAEIATTLKSGSTEKPSSEHQIRNRADGKDTKGSRDCNGNEFFCSGIKQSAFNAGLLLAVLGLLVELTILVVLGLRMQRDIRTRLPHPKSRLAGVEEGRNVTTTDRQPLLNPAREMKSNGIVMNGSAYVAPSHQPRSAGAGPQMQQDGSLAGVAPVATGENFPGREQRENNDLHQLVTNKA